MPSKPSILDDDVLDHDEKVHHITQSILEEANDLEDTYTKELYLDALQSFARDGDIASLVGITTWRRSVVPIDEFLFSSTYLGITESELYPSVLEACHELDTGQYVECVPTGAIGTGKSTLANIMLARELYKISCMRHPQLTFGVQAKSGIVFTIQSVRFRTAQKAIFEELGQYIDNSPYFREIYPRDKTISSQMVFREHRVSVLPVTSSDTGAISMNVIGGILDEVNFMQKIKKSVSSNAEDDGSFDQAKRLYNTISRRRRSRFTRKGNLPGILFLISSSRYPDDFTEQKAAESTMEGGTDPTIYVYRKSQWEAKPRETFLSEEFQVQVGNETVRSKVLVEKELPNLDCRTVNVPMDFYNEFVKDVDGSLRDYCGITSLATRPFIHRRDAITEAMQFATKHGWQNITNVEEVDITLGLPTVIKNRIRHDVDNYRACHIDLAVTKDACGIAIAHVAGARVIELKNEITGEEEFQIMPVIGFDLILRVVPPPGGEIEFADIRMFIRKLRDKYGLDIRYVTFDGFQSIDSRQILRKHGFQTDYLSVEKIEPYRSFRDALYEKRILLSPHQFLAKELAELEIVTKNNKDKVDHRPSGSKDVADAVVGVTSFLLRRRSAWSNIQIDSPTGLHLYGDSKKVRKSKGKRGARKEDDGRVVITRHSIVRRNIKRKTIKRK